MDGMSFDPPTKDELLALWRSLYGPAYSRPIEEEANGQGLDVYAQQAAQIARVGEAIAVTTQACYLRPSSLQVRPPAAGQRRSEGTVLVYRAPPAIGDVVLDTGVLLVVRGFGTRGEILDGEVFAVSAATTLPAGSVGPTEVPVRAVRYGYQGNVPAGSITAFVERGRAEIDGVVGADNEMVDNEEPDRWSPKMVGQYVRFTAGPNAGTTPRRILSVTQEPVTFYAVLDGPALTPGAATVEVEEFSDLGLSVDQVLDTTGGRHGFLDAIGADRGAGRTIGETDDQYRARIGALSDVVSPNAILRAAARVLTPLGISFVLEETRDPLGLRGFIFDWDFFDTGSIADGNVLLSEADATRFFVLRVGNGSEGEFGFAYDAVGPLASNAYDASGPARNYYDGFPRGYYATIASLWAAIEAARAAGVRWMIVRDPTL